MGSILYLNERIMFKKTWDFQSNFALHCVYWIGLIFVMQISVKYPKLCKYNWSKNYIKISGRNKDTFKPCLKRDEVYLTSWWGDGGDPLIPQTNTGVRRGGEGWLKCSERGLGHPSFLWLCERGGLYRRWSRSPHFFSRKNPNFLLQNYKHVNKHETTVNLSHVQIGSIRESPRTPGPWIYI